MSEGHGLGATEGARPRFDQTQREYALGQLRSEQNLTLGALAGAAGALVGAMIWALITAVTKFQIGWMAVGVGFLVGFGVRTFGKGIDREFGIVGALLALLGCGLGNLLAVCGIIAGEQDVPFLDIVSGLSPRVIHDLILGTFGPMDILFYGIAIYEGYKLSIRQLTEQDIASRITGQGRRE